VEITGELALLCVASGLSDGNHEDVDTNLGAVVVRIVVSIVPFFIFLSCCHPKSYETLMLAAGALNDIRIDEITATYACHSLPQDRRYIDAIRGSV